MKGKKKSKQEQIANRLGCSQSFLSKWVRGKIGMSVETAKAWGKVLKKDPGKILLSKVKDRPKLVGLI